MSQGEGVRPPGDEAAGLTDPHAPWEELIEDPHAPRRLLAVMFTDIVGSTELATTLGDKRWRELIDQHHAAIRNQIARFGGTEVDTAGDAFFATFELPVRAVDCALGSIRAVRRLGLRIRAGVHMGECVVSDGHVRGVTVHIGARVGAKATGGELIVSSTIRDVLAGAGLTFRDRGEQILKGVEGRWRLYAVEPRERDNAADLPPLLEAEIAKPPLPWWQRRRTLVAGVVALALLAAAAAFIVTGGGGLSSVPADSVAVIDTGSLDVISTVKVGARPVGIATARDGVWVTNSYDRSVSFVSSEGSSIKTTTGLGASPTSAVVAGKLLWVANADGKTISRVSTETSQEVGERIVAGNGLADIAYGAGAVWVTNSVDGTLWRIDPASEEKLEIKVGPALRGVAVADQAVWVASELGQNVSKIDARSRAVVGVTQVGRGPRAIAVGAGGVWVANAFDGTVSRIDPSTGRVAATVRVGEGPRAIAVARGKVFVANEYDSPPSVSVIDAASNRVVKHISLQNPPMGLAADGDRVWVSVRGGSTQYRGGTLRLGTSINLIGDPEFGPAVSFDPPFAFPQFGFAVMPALYDGLTAFKQVGGVEGAEVVPNLAEDIRPPTDGGATYSFTLRPGLRYSDGSAVKASDVRESFERVYRVDISRVTAPLLRVIKGTERCDAKACDLSAGIVTDDTARTVTFHLRGAVSDFPAILALPGASVISAKTPVRNMVLEPIPGTGPYRLASAKGDALKGPGEAVFERNRYFRPRGLGSPGGYADRIVVSWGSTPTKQVEATKSGRTDWTIDAQEPEINAKQLALDVPAQLHIFDLPSVTYAVLNPRVPPFNDVKARRALNLAVDRAAIARAFEYTFGASPTCQVLPKNMIGYRPYCPYTANPGASGQWSAPDLAAARRLVTESGTAGTAVTVWLDDRPSPWREQTAPIIAKALRDIGYRTSVERFDGDLIEAQFTGRPPIQIAIEGWASDYPAASSFFVPLLTCNELVEKLLGDPNAGFNLARFCSKEVDQKIERALAAQREDAAEAGDLWAEVDRMVSDQAPWVALSTLKIPVLVSARVGNVLMNPALGPLLTQMWVVEEPQPGPSG